ncbi:MAG: hypothetical protein R3B96_06415 [Pirellulaceae bacterium]
MSESANGVHGSATESPWFWAYLFGMAGIILGWIARFHWVARQARLERRYLQPSALPRAVEQGGSRPVGERCSLRRSLADEAQRIATERAVARWRQLLCFLAILVSFCWLGWIWQRRRIPAHAPDSENGDADRVPS